MMPVGDHQLLVLHGFVDRGHALRLAITPSRCATP